MKSIVTVQCLKFWSDWTDEVKVEIDIKEYVFFGIEYRGENSWHIVGHKCDKDYNWTTEELSLHQVFGIVNLADFIVKVNSYVSKHSTRCRVSRFNNLHYYNGFYKELTKLFKLVEEKESKEK
jgi:hypothetical protein